MPAHSPPVTRFSVWELAGVVFALVLAAIFLLQQYRAQQTLLFGQYTQALDVAYRATIETYRLDVETRFRLQVSRPEVIELMEEALATPEESMPQVRGRLFRLLKPVYDELQAIGLRQFQFHLADDRVLLRFHRPQVAGDRLFAARPSIRIANLERRPITGLEVGRTQPGFRYVFPLEGAGRHLGSAELSLPFERIQENLAHLLPQSEFGLLLHKEAVLGKVDIGSQEKYIEATIHPGFLIENPTISRVVRNLEQSTWVKSLEPLLRQDPDVQRKLELGESFVAPLFVNDQTSTATFLAVPDLEGKKVGYVVRFADATALADLRKGIIHQAILAMFLIFGLSTTTHYVRRQHRALKEDIAQRIAAEGGLRLYESIFRYSDEAILVTDHRNRIVSVNPAFTRLTGYSLDEVRGSDPRILSSGDTPPETYQTLWASLGSVGHWQGELADRRRDGTTYPKWAAISVIRDEAGLITHHIASFSDISERKAAQARIERLAHHDALTGLLNRYSLESRLEQGLLTARRENQWVAILFIDMDRFKTINDTFGHHIGDLLLKEVAARLSSHVRQSDIVARQGGDEFVVALTGLVSPHDASPVANKLLRSLGEVYDIEGLILHSSPSIGIALFPDDAEDAEQLLKHADAAMYEAKKKGRNTIQYFTAEMTLVASERLAIERDLHVALAERQFLLYYQPQIRAADRRIRGVEALVRWNHPARGLVPPDQFIPIAEETGLIEAIGAWVLDEACRQFAAWRAEGVPRLCVAVNLSAHQLRSPHLVTLVRDCMTRYTLSAGDLELEVTESVAMENPAQAISQLQALRDLHVELAIDDFGTGYSSLAYLKHLPIDTIKLDKSFVRDIETDSNDATICAATIALAHALGLKVVAEGVETQAQAEFLAVAHGCDILQGYLFGRPEPAESISAHLSRNRLQPVHKATDQG